MVATRQEPSADGTSPKVLKYPAKKRIKIMDLPELPGWVNLQTASEIGGTSRQYLHDILEAFEPGTTLFRVGNQAVIARDSVQAWADERMARFEAEAAKYATE